MPEDYYSEAETRVFRSEKLNKYHHIIMQDCWSESDHFEWVAHAPERDILDWAKTIDRDVQLEDF